MLTARRESSQSNRHDVRRKVLVIEDSRDSADSLRMLLELLGHEVRVAYSGLVGLKAANEWLPDVVISDIGLPGMDGYALASELRRAGHGWGPSHRRQRLWARRGPSERGRPASIFTWSNQPLPRTCSDC